MAEAKKRTIQVRDDTNIVKGKEYHELVDHIGGDRYKEYDIAPYVEMVECSLPIELWSSVFYAWSSLKGFIQAVHGLQRVEMFASRDGDEVFACFFTVWASADALAEWEKNGYPTQEVLAGLGVPEDQIVVRLIRDYS